MHLQFFERYINLTRPQKNLIYEAIAQAGLDATQCDLKITENGFRIECEGGSSISAVLWESGLRYFLASQYGIAKQRLSFSAHVSNGKMWQRVVKADLNKILPVIRQWAIDVREVEEAPDLWAQAQRSRDVLADIQKSKFENTPFTQDEQRRIADHLREVKERIREQFDLTDEQTAHIDEGLDEAAEAAERIGRKDWHLLLYGTIVNLVVADALPPEVARHILSMIVQVIAHLFGGGEPPRILT